jgi:hypothetical protein
MLCVWDASCLVTYLAAPYPIHPGYYMPYNTIPAKNRVDESEDEIIMLYWMLTGPVAVKVDEF